MTFIAPVSSVLCVLSACVVVAAGTNLSPVLLSQNHNGPTSDGTDFVVAFMRNVDNSVTDSRAFLYVLNKSPTETAIVDVTLPNNPSFPGYPQTGIRIGPNSRRAFQFSSTGSNNIRVIQDGLMDSNKGIRVKSTNNVPVTVVGSNSERKSTDAFLALPCQTATTNRYRYYVFSSSPQGNLLSQFVVVACEDNPSVTFRLKDQTTDQRPLADLKSSEVFSYSASGDLTGATIVSNSPIAVFSGHQCGLVTESNTACDHLVEQIPMHAVWGNTFFTAPFGYRGSGERYRIGTLLPDNEVSITCSRRGEGIETTYSRTTEVLRTLGAYHELVTTSTMGPPSTYRREFCCIETSKPAIVMQYMPGHSLDETTVDGIGNGIGDPSISIIPPVEQYRSSFIGTEITTTDSSFANMATWAVSSFFFDPATDADEVLLDNKPLRPTSLQGGSGGYIEIQCSNGEVCGYSAFSPIPVSGGSFRLDFNSTKNAYAGMNFNLYGYVAEMSYAYSAGFEMEPIGLARITVYNMTVPEDIGTVTVIFNRTGGDLSTNSRIFAQTRSVTGQAVVGTDYNAVGRTRIRWQQNAVDPNPNDPKFTVTILDDETAESDEYFEVFFVVDVNGYPFPGVARITILDNDGVDLPDVQFDPTTYTVTEGQQQTITLELSSASSTPVMATVRSTDGTAIAGTDYEAIEQTVTFPANMLTATFSVRTVNDEINEPSENFELTITGATNANVGTDDKATVTITDNDDLSVQFNPDSYTVNEGESAQFMVVLNRQASREVTVMFSTADGTAASPGDYTATSMTVTFAAGETTQTVTVQTATDSVMDNGETFTATLTNPTNGLQIGPASTGTVTILDPVAVSFDPSSYTVTEGVNSSAVISVVLSRAATDEVTVNFATADGSASSIDSSDYTATTSTVTFPAGSQIQMVSVPINDDNINELTESFTAQLSNPSGAELGTDTATITINDNDDLTVNFDPVTYTVLEGNSAQFRARLNRRADRDVSVIFNTADGSATSSDYTPVLARTISFTAGSTGQTVDVETLTDSIMDNGETFSAALSAPTNGLQLGSDVTATATILDPVVVRFNPSAYTVTEGVDSAVMVGIELSRQDAETITVEFSTLNGTAQAPSDYTAITSTVTFSPGTTNQTVSVPINNDNINELTESFTAQLSNPSGAELGTNTATITINDNDNLEFSITPASISVEEGQTGILTVQLNVAADRSVSVEVTSGGGTATPGTDYAAISRVVTFPAGNTAAAVTAVTMQDELDEPDETFVVSLSNPTGGGTVGTPSSSTVTIDDDDAPISIQFEPAVYNASEGTSADLMVVLSRDPAEEVEVTVTTVSGTATGDVDYTSISRTLTFPAGGSRTMTVSVPISSDSINDPDESFTAVLSDSVGAVLGSATTATVNIIDTNPVNVQFIPDEYSVSEGSSVNVIAMLNVRSTQDLTVDFDTEPGTATSGDYTAVRRTLTFSAGEISVPVSVMATDDDLGEPDEDFTAHLRNPGPGLSVGEQDTATITILENDTPDVSFNPSDYTITEGGSEMLRLVLSNPSTSEVTVEVSTADGSATAPNDYQALTRTVTFAPNSTTALVTVVANTDNINERPENFTATLSNPSGATLGTPTQATITVIESSDLFVFFDPDEYFVEEGRSVTLNASLNSIADRDVTVQVRLVPGSATDPEDYINGIRTLTFQAGSTKASTTVSTEDDDIQEGVERFSAVLQNPQGGLIIEDPSTATIDITDNDVVMVMFNPSSYTVNEGDSETVTVELSLSSTQTVTVDVSSSGDTATDTDDYTTVSQTLTFQPGSTSATFQVMAQTDGIDELQERFFLTLSNPSSNAMIGAPSRATVFIDDTNDLLVNFDPTSYSVNEGEAVNLTARLNNPADRDVSVEFSTVSGTASDESDFSPLMRTITFSRGQTVATITVMTTDDEIQEGTERFTATLTNPTNGLAVGSDGTATVDINDDDVVNVQFQPDSYTVSEGDGTAELTVVLTKPSANQVLVDIATSEGSARDTLDYIPVSMTLTFEPNQISEMVPITIVNDNTNERDEMFTATLSSPQGAELGSASTATIEITDDDPLTIQFNPTQYTGEEGDSTSLIAVLNRPADRAIMVTLETNDGTAVAPQDYSRTSVVLTFPAGEQSATASIPIADDEVNEREESFTASLSNPTGGATIGTNNTATVTIPNPQPLTVNFNPDTYTVEEGESVDLTITLNSEADREVSVDVMLNPDTATAGTDYEVQTYSVTFPAGDTSRTITVMTIEDSLSEGDEDFFASLTNPVGDDFSIGDMGTATVTIDDDDDITVNFNPTLYTVNEGESVNVSIVLSNPSTSDVVVDVVTVTNTATEPDDYLPVNQQVTFAPGQQMRFVTVTTVQDSDDEENEMFSVLLRNPSGASLGTDSRAEVTINDDDLVVLEFDRTSYTVNEGDNAVITVVADRPPAMDVTVMITTSDGTAISPDDYTDVSRVVTIPSGERSATVMISTTNDNTGEGDEMFRVRLSNPSQDAAVGDRDEASVLIMDNDPITVNFEDTDYSVPESQDSVMVCITLSNPASEDITITGETMALVPPQAEDEVDFSHKTLVFMVPAGNTSACDNVKIIDDSIVEEREKFEVTLASPMSSLVTLGDNSKANITIIDDDSLEVNFQRDSYTIPENDGPLEVCAELNIEASEDVTVVVQPKESDVQDAEEDSDFIAAPVSITFKAGQTLACGNLTIRNDNIREKDIERFFIDIDVPQQPISPRPGPRSSVPVDIIDDDVITVSWETPEIIVPESSGQIMVCFTTDKESSTAYTVPITIEGITSNPATFGVDYNATSQNIEVAIPAGAAGQHCVPVTILDDGIAMEGNQTFALRFVDLPSRVVTGSVPQTSVVIVDDDVVAVDFETPDMTVSEGDGDVMVCIIRNATTENPMSVTVSTRFGSAGVTDIEPVTTELTFEPTQNRTCVDVPIKNDLTPENREFFSLGFAPQPGVVTPAPGNVANVTIIDDDGPTTTACIIQDSLMVSPFNATPSFQFRGVCELTAVRPCGDSPDFSVRVDYLTESLDIGAVGIVKDGLVWSIRENRMVETTSDEDTVTSGNDTVYEESGVTVTRSGNVISLAVRDGIEATVTRTFTEDGSTVMITGGTLSTCGICGTQQGQLRSLDGTITPISASMEAKQAFVSGYRVPARDQVLRPARAECAVVRNDSIIGDPLYTVPFGTENLNLCYEIYGRANTTFNLISDTCVNVNAFYAGVGDLNIISTIAVRAKDNNGACRNIQVDLENCAAFASPREAGGASPREGDNLVQLSGTLEEEGISVRSYINRIRISVPNCQNMKLVMWVTCVNNPRTLQLHVMRGVNLRPTSHGLLGQFWNIPITATRLTTRNYNVTIQPMNGASTRYLQGEYFSRTWENKEEPCIYVGNAQGGPSGENPRIDDSVIQGNYRNYIMNDLFDTDYVYEEWDAKCQSSS